MTTERRLERDLPQILGDLAMGPYPEYIDDVLATTAQRRQRPAWMFPERWLPMVDIARHPVPVPRVPWRTISIAAVTIALLLAATAVFIGAQARVPDPFGPARNGLIAYDASGDIYTADPSTGAATAIVSGPDEDVAPYYSRDGSHIVFERKLGDGLGQLYVVGIDGSDLTLVTPEPVLLQHEEAAQAYEFAPDGRSVLFASTKNVSPSISIAQSDGSGVRQLEVGMAAYEPSFRPPDGAEILFAGGLPGSSSGRGLYAVDVASGTVRTIVAPSAPFDLGGGAWSPDGSRIAYYAWIPSDGITARTHVIAADGTGDRELLSPPDSVWNASPTWSNDGTRLFIVRGHTSGYEDVRPAVVPADGSTVGIELPYEGAINRECCADFEWAPDDSRILVVPTDTLGKPQQQVILDPLTGTSEPVSWTSTSDATWQRLAP